MTDFPQPPARSEAVDGIVRGELPKNWFTPNWVKWFQQVSRLLTFSGLSENQSTNAPGLTVTIVTAPLTGGGATGSMTFQNGILTINIPAT